MAGLHWAVVLDFDGTVAMTDVGDSILMRFGGLTKAEIRASYDPRVATEDWMKENFLRVRASLDDMRRYVLSTVRPRPGAGRFLDWCREAGIPVEIVSGGVDLYLDPLLEKWRLSPVRRFRAASRLTSGGIRLGYPFLKGEALDAFKRGRVEAHQRRGRRVLFAGDGTSDLQAARTADLAFATGVLWRRCRDKGIPVKRLTDFDGVRKQLCTRL